MSYFERHIAPMSAKPNSRAPLFPSSTYFWNSGRMGGEMVCHPRQASSSLAGSVLVRRMSLN